MDKQEIKSYLMSLFPDLPESKAEYLASTGEEINVLITRVLDNNIDPPTFEIKDLIRKPRTGYKTVKTYNYPEVFKMYSSIDMHLDVQGLRKQAAQLNSEAAEITKNAISHPIKESRIYYSIEADNLREKAKELNNKAVHILMRRAVEKTGPIDLHGFTVEEALKFISDLYTFKNFKKIEVITGQVHNSSRIRPAIIEWFKKHNFLIKDEGPAVVATKKTEEMFNTYYK